MAMSDSELQLYTVSMELHQAWMAMVNFHHPGLFSSHATEAMVAMHKRRAVIDAYDQAFGNFTAICELLRQQRELLRQS